MRKILKNLINQALTNESPYDKNYYTKVLTQECDHFLKLFSNRPAPIMPA